MEIVRSVADIAAKQSPAELFDFFFDRYAEAHSRRLPLTPEPIAALMARLTGVAGRDVLDPACGTGAFLLAAQTAGATALFGQDTDETTARLAACRLLLREAPVSIAVGDSLRHDGFPDTRVGAVLCNPPFNDRSWGYDELANDPRWQYGLPPRSEPELAWVQHCLAHLQPGGQAAIMMPAGAASRRSGRRIRSNLLRSGALTAVVSLPNLAQLAAAPDLWVLRQPTADDPSPSHVLVVDAAEDLSVVEPAWRSYLADPERDPPGPSRALRIIDLLDDEVDISPARRLTERAIGPEPGEFPSLRARLLSMSAHPADTLPDLTVLARSYGC